MGSREIDQFRAAFDRRISGASAGSFWATIETVDTAERTCVVSDDTVQYEDVLLYGVADERLKGFCLIPSVGSRVIVSRLGGSNSLYVSMFSQLDELLLTISDTELTVSDDGFSLIRSESGLKKTLSDLCDAIAKLTVTTGVGPSGLPINAADFIKIKKDLNNYLKK